jgi:hypothetical protein
LDIDKGGEGDEKLMENVVFSRFKYKDEYEKFKFIVNGIGLLMALLNIVINSRWVWVD